LDLTAALALAGVMVDVEEADDEDPEAGKKVDTNGI
jgi:hypothetical protein